MDHPHAVSADKLISKLNQSTSAVCENGRVDNYLSPGEKALSIQLIRRKILWEFSTAKDLLLYRSVCKRWEKEATSALLQPKFQRALQISFRYSESSSAFISHNQKQSGRSLGDFMQDRVDARKRKGLVQNTDADADDENEEENQSQAQSKCHVNFLEDVCTFFKFQGGSLGSDPDALRFFMEPYPENGIHSKIRGLTLNFHRESAWKSRVWDEGRLSISVENFRNLLLIRRKSLEYLHLVQVPRDWGWHDELFFGSDLYRLIDLESRSFPALEIVKLSSSPFQYSPLVIGGILRGARNLKETHFHQPGDNLEVLQQEQKLHTLKSWFFTPWMPRRNNDWTRLLENLEKIPTKLFKFGVYQNSVEKTGIAVPVLNRLLSQSQQSLQVVWDVMTLFNCQPFGLIIPEGRFPKVTKVTQGQPFSALAKVDMTTAFPKVKHFKINYSKLFNYGDGTREMQLIDDLDLCLTSPMTSVTTCSFYFYERNISSLEEERLLKALKTFPNLVDIRVSTSRVPKELPQLLRLIFKWLPHARAISFKFRYRNKEDYPSWSDDVHDGFLLDEEWLEQMDAAITGIQNQNQQVLCADVREREKKKDHSQTLSILNMKDLQYFGMDFGFIFPPPRLFSQLAFEYGFDVMKKQKTDFELEFQPKVLPFT